MYRSHSADSEGDERTVSSLTSFGSRYDREKGFHKI